MMMDTDRPSTPLRGGREGQLNYKGNLSSSGTSSCLRRQKTSKDQGGEGNYCTDKPSPSSHLSEDLLFFSGKRLRKLFINLRDPQVDDIIDKSYCPIFGRQCLSVLPVGTLWPTANVVDLGKSGINSEMRRDVSNGEVTTEFFSNECSKFLPRL